MCGLTQVKCDVLSSTNKTAIVTGLNDGIDTMGGLIIPSTVKIDGVYYTVTEIEDCAFTGYGLTGELTIPDSVTTIYFAAFYGCGFTGELIIPDSVTTIGDEAFYECKFIGDVTIPNSVTTIGDCVFSRCDNINSISIPCSAGSSIDWG